MTFGIANDGTTQEVLNKFPVLEHLCNQVHGSGIDYDWYAVEGAKHVILSNSYHAMNENGMYVAVIDFQILFPKKGFMNYKVQCTGGSRYWWNNNALKTYVDDIIAYALLDYIEKNESVAPNKSGVRERKEYDFIEVKNNGE